MIGKILTFIIILVLLGIAGGYYLGTNYKFTLQPQNAVTTTAPLPSATPTSTDETILNTVTPGAAVTSPTPSAGSGQAVDETADILAAVKAGLVAGHGPDAASMTVTVSKIVGDFAQGGASAQGGGGMWFAAKVGGAWKLVWDGNGTISCASINQYNFPSTMIPECYDAETQKLITR
jgi:hypothetical protein